YPSCHLNSVQMSRVLSFKSLCNKAVSFSQNYYHALSNGRDFIAYNLLYGLNKQVIKANEVFILNDMNNKKNIDIFGQAAHDGSRISRGEYKDIVPITIEF
ncbi:hypothetical protein ABTJ61_19115, partial [Acinetobacter baumannii]